MHGGIQIERDIQLHQKIRSLVAKTQLWTGSLVKRVVSLPTETNISRLPVQRAHDMIPPLGIIIGTAAFGFWWHSVQAGLFACCSLFFLAGIYRATERIVGVVVRWERDSIARPSPDRHASSSVEPSHGNSDAISEAIDRLKPWVADEVPLTEEDVRVSCAVLLESVAPRYTNKAP